MVIEEQLKDSPEFEDVNKAIRAYVNTLNTAIDAENLTFADFLQDKMLLIYAIRKGFSYRLFHKIRKITPFTEDDWAEYLNLSTKTLQRYKNDPDRFFKPIHTEKIIELAEVTTFGNEVFDSAVQFYTWLNSPSFALGNLKPAELLKDSYGKELVMGELNRIDQGIFV